MPKSKANTVAQIGQRNLIDATAMGQLVGFTSKWVNAMAAKNLIPWHGVRNGAKVFRRFDPAEVMAALSHDVETPVKPVVQAHTNKARAKAS